MTHLLFEKFFIPPQTKNRLGKFLSCFEEQMAELQPECVPGIGLTEKSGQIPFPLPKKAIHQWIFY